MINMNNKIHLFRDREDYIKELTKDNVFNVTGEKGSGKSYFGISKEKDYIVVHLDPVFTPEASEDSEYSKEIREYLIDKYGEITDSEFSKYYKDIIKYLDKYNKIICIEGGSIAEVEDLSILKGTVIVKRTGIFKCFIRVINRDYHNKYFMDLEKKKHKYFYKIVRLRNVIKRRKKIFKSYHLIEDFIKKLDNYK